MADASSSPSPTAAAATPPPPQQPSPSPSRRASSFHRSSSSSGLVLRRQSTRERIDQILETGLARAESRSRSGSVAQAPSPLPQQQEQHQQPRMEPLLCAASRPGRIPEHDDDDEAAIDESTSIVNAASSSSSAGRAAAVAQPPNYQSTTIRSRRSPRPPDDPTHQESNGRELLEGGAQPTQGRSTGFFGSLKKTLASFGSVELDNKGSVARDHLALERTFLAWLRTSVSFASIGIAVTQLFRLNTTLKSGGNGGSDGGSGGNGGSGESGSGGGQDELRRLGKPLGAAFLAISILILFLGYSRYVRSQKWIMTGRFPASRGTVVLVTLVTFGVMVASLAIVVIFSPGPVG